MKVKPVFIKAGAIFIIAYAILPLLAEAGSTGPRTIPLNVPLPQFTGPDVSRVVFPSQYIRAFYQLALGAGALLAMGMIVFGAIQYTLSAGNVGNQEDARDRIRSAILGLILLLGTTFILFNLNPRILQLEELEVLVEGTTVPPPERLVPAKPTGLTASIDLDTRSFNFDWNWSDSRCGPEDESGFFLLENSQPFRLYGYFGQENPPRSGNYPNTGTLWQPIRAVGTINLDRGTPGYRCQNRSGGNSFSTSLVEDPVLLNYAGFAIKAVSDRWIESESSDTLINPIGRPDAPDLLRLLNYPEVSWLDNSRNERWFIVEATLSDNPSDNLAYFTVHSIPCQGHNGQELYNWCTDRGVRRFHLIDADVRDGHWNYIRISAKNAVGWSDPSLPIDIRAWTGGI